MTQTNLRSLARIRRFDARPILVGGCGRSGTTLLLAMLGAHPRIAVIPYETALFARLRKRTFPTLEHRLMVARAQLLLAREPIDERAHRWCEKTPGNVVALPRLLDNFGDRVRFVHLVRDGRDVMSSQYPNRPGPYVRLERWVEDVSMGLRYENDPRVYTLRYEALVTEYESTMTGLLDFLGEPFGEEMRAFHRFTTVARSTAWEGGQVRPLSSKSVGKWRRPESADRVAEVMAFPPAVTLLKRLGYLPD